MDNLHPTVSLPHIVQVYQPAVQPPLSNQDSINDSLNFQNVLQSQTVMSCHQIHLQNVQQTMHASIPGPQNECQPLHITSHVILPQVPLIKHSLNGSVHQQYYSQYNTVSKETKPEPNLPIIVKNEDLVKSEVRNKINKENLTRRRRILRVPDPSQWQNNIRKKKCQQGEAYISRRGKLVPEKQIRNKKDCLNSCRFKCMEKINDEDRQLLFKSFYSLDTNEKKYFLLNTTERHLIKTKDRPCDGKRNYTYKYFFYIRTDKFVVCKNFYLGTLAISQKPIYNVHLNKSEVNIPKRDGRGLSSCHPLPEREKDRVRKHIMSLETIDSKPINPFSLKQQYLDSNLTVKQMYIMYVTECEKIGESPLKESMYRKIFKNEFNICFKKEKVCGKCKGPIV
ncbi:uncharacterized protein LOC123709672 [Pieris brassicae]|uniref:uncharacterized protein LOC123709672 n=1 Tax=Pieris brassicae TaxID=7116 RepID=UPI001E65E4B9|nr:uncharacterized protein LOC123709672 [Pieris brassicae]